MFHAKQKNQVPNVAHEPKCRACRRGPGAHAGEIRNGKREHPTSSSSQNERTTHASCLVQRLCRRRKLRGRACRLVTTAMLAMLSGSGERYARVTPTASAQRTRFQLRRPSEREGGVCCKPELGSARQLGLHVSLRLQPRGILFEQRSRPGRPYRRWRWWRASTRLVGLARSHRY